MGKSSAGKSSGVPGFGGKSNKPSSSSTGKSSTLSIGKSSSSFPSSSSKVYPPITYGTPKSSKSSFGIIWLPTRKNKKKDMVYNPNRDYRDDSRSPTMYNFMSGDSEYKTYKKEEEKTLIVPDRKVPVAAAAAGVSTTVTETGTNTDDVANTSKPEEKQEFIQRDKEDSKEAGGDTNDKEDKEKKPDTDEDYLENKDKSSNKTTDSKWEKSKLEDNVDSVYLRPPPPHKVRSNTSTNEEEDCGIKCLYYTLQCCDCVLM